jgi:hypothetical protein
MRRSFMPVLAMIHASLVSTISSKSALVKTPAGTHEPVPVIFALYIVWSISQSLRCLHACHGAEAHDICVPHLSGFSHVPTGVLPFMKHARRAISVGANRNHLTAFIVAALGAYMMRPGRLTTLRTGCKVDFCQAVMCTPATAP